MGIRSDGSYQSANTPTWANTGSFKEDYNLYRCMVTRVFYVDDNLNITQKSQNPEVIYQVVILGGFKSGQTLTNVRMGPEIGGDDNYTETILTPASKPITDTRLSDQDGDIVMVQFIQGHQGYPVIIAHGNSLNATKGTKKADGPRRVTQYNGLKQTINNAGELTITRNGGSLNPSTNRFKPNTVMDSEISLKKDQLITLTTKTGTMIQVDGKNDKVTTLTAGGLSSIVDGKNDVATITTAGGANVKVDGKSDQILLKTSGGGELNLKAGKVALGAPSAEIFQQFHDTLEKLIIFVNTVDATHSHFGNLGYAVSPPITASNFTQLGADLLVIQGLIDGIKGTL